MLYKSHPLVLIDGYDHEDRRRDADEGMSSEAGRPAVKGSFKPNQRSDNECAGHFADHHQVIVALVDVLSSYTNFRAVNPMI
jgi:hypothetical protein